MENAADEASPLLLLPPEVLKLIVLAATHSEPRQCKGSPSFALSVTCKEARAALLPWIGRTYIAFPYKAHAREAVAQLLRFPHMATLRDLRLKLGSRTEAALASFLRDRQAVDRLATVLRLRVDYDESPATEVMTFPAAMGCIAKAFYRSLQALTCTSTQQTFRYIRALTPLSFLQELHLLTPPVAILAEDAEALGSLVSLRTLTVASNSPDQLLPHLSNLTGLSKLHVVSDEEGLARSSDGFSSLPALPSLMSLTWGPLDPSWDRRPLYSYPLRDATLAAICSSSRLVTLHLRHHRISGNSNVRLLLAMPLLQHLSVHSLKPDDEVSVRHLGGSLKELVMHACYLRHQALTRLSPVLLSGLKLSLHRSVMWALSSGSSAEAISAVARDVHAAARVLSIAEDLQTPPKLEVRLVWSGKPAQPAGTVIASLAPLRLTSLVLVDWEVDKALALQLAAAAPGLRHLVFVSCLISYDGWQGLEALTQLTDLRLGVGPITFLTTREALTAFALTVSGRDMEINIQIRDGLAARKVEACHENIQELRQARGLSGSLKLTAVL